MEVVLSHLILFTHLCQKDILVGHLVIVIQINVDVHCADECTLSGSEKSLTDQPSSETVSASEDDSDPTIGWCGFRIVGDNIDKTVRPRDMRHNHQSTSLHYFHSYAVKDRVDVSDLSPEVPLVTSKEIDVNLFLPSPEDCQSLEANFCTLMTRILVKHIPGISHLSSVVLQHIPHPYSVAMSKKSEVVCLYIKNNI